VTADGRDYLFYEEESGESALDLITTGTRFATWYATACAAMRRQGLFTGTPDEFREQVSFVLPVAGTDPTEPPIQREDSENLS
jgi:hypothetical protein